MAELTILYDGGCPLCVREVRFLAERDRRCHPGEPRLAFVDIDAADYDPIAHGGIGYRQAMGRIHALGPAGEVLLDVEVFRRAYGLIGLGWLYAPTGWPLLAPLVNALYAIWASARLRITGRPCLEQLCAVGGRCGPGLGSAEDQGGGQASAAAVTGAGPRTLSPLMATSQGAALSVAQPAPHALDHGRPHSEQQP